MAHRSSPSGLQLCFFAPIRRDAGSTKIYARPPVALRIVLVSSRSAATHSGAGFESWYDVEQDCADCDCACFTDEE